MSIKDYINGLREANAEVKRADAHLMNAGNREEFEQRNAEADEAVERRRDAIVGHRRNR
ncbi:hypothetical protein [Pseudonocardia acaciae]|uniref:hypothetical protein n=1 Tax=Pseudonocardia acaciae TaxID=551276 RepID=UPI000A6A20AD|nr:hypothetical protein [Pseudonocardia acaciae]